MFHISSHIWFRGILITRPSVPAKLTLIKQNNFILSPDLFNSLRPWDNWSESWLVHVIACACTPRRHHMNQCWLVVIWTLGNNFQSKFNQNRSIFIQENALKNVVCKMAAILFQSRCDNPYMACHMRIKQPEQSAHQSPGEPGYCSVESSDV